MARYRGRVAMAGFLGGGAPLTLDPLTQDRACVQPRLPTRATGKRGAHSKPLED